MLQGRKQGGVSASRLETRRECFKVENKEGVLQGRKGEGVLLGRKQEGSASRQEKPG